MHKLVRWCGQPAAIRCQLNMPECPRMFHKRRFSDQTKSPPVLCSPEELSDDVFVAFHLKFCMLSVRMRPFKWLWACHTQVCLIDREGWRKLGIGKNWKMNRWGTSLVFQEGEGCDYFRRTAGFPQGCVHDRRGRPGRSTALLFGPSQTTLNSSMNTSVVSARIAAPMFRAGTDATAGTEPRLPCRAVVLTRPMTV